jgi:hypothetical protein
VVYCWCWFCFWVFAPCGCRKYCRHFGGTCSLQLQGLSGYSWRPIYIYIYIYIWVLAQQNHFRAGRNSGQGHAIKVSCFRPQRAPEYCRKLVFPSATRIVRWALGWRPLVDTVADSSLVNCMILKKGHLIVSPCPLSLLFPADREPPLSPMGLLDQSLFVHEVTLLTYTLQTEAAFTCGTSSALPTSTQSKGAWAESAWNSVYVQETFRNLRIWGSHRGGYEKFYLFGYSVV